MPRGLPRGNRARKPTRGERGPFSEECAQWEPHVAAQGRQPRDTPGLCLGEEGEGLAAGPRQKHGPTLQSGPVAWGLSNLTPWTWVALTKANATLRTGVQPHFAQSCIKV